MTYSVLYMMEIAGIRLYGWLFALHSTVTLVGFVLHSADDEPHVRNCIRKYTSDYTAVEKK